MKISINELYIPRHTSCEILNHKEVLQLLPDVDESCFTGVYFLIKNRRVIYVGQSVNIFSRLREHRKDKDFDSFKFLQCKRHELDVIESKYIYALKPKLNMKKDNAGKFIAGKYLAPLGEDHFKLQQST